MGAVSVAKLTREVAAELSDAELTELANDEDADNARVAQLALERRREQSRRERPADPDPEPDPGAALITTMDDVQIEGSAQLEMFDLGGKRPTGATLALTGGKVQLVQGEAFRKGDVVTLRVQAVVHDVGQKDTHDPKTGQVVSCEQRHKARIIDLSLESAGA